ncbi:MAG: hypothetical protein M1818_006140 [Claussenomyces sp. TS43310]|nr:MAG: hypothetical protein M1818_006140 [Claussenomyces sp. TS43310]
MGGYEHPGIFHRFYKERRYRCPARERTSRRAWTDIYHGHLLKAPDAVLTIPKRERRATMEFESSYSRDTKSLRTSIPSTQSTITGPMRATSRTPSPRRSVLAIMDFLRVQPQHPSDPSVASTSMSQIQLLDSLGRNLATAEKAKTRLMIRRQLRFLFIYPLIYMGTWAAPFAMQVLQYDNRFALHPPFWLSCLEGTMMASQCAVDCWVFSTREKPWRHIPGSNGSLWESFKCGPPSGQGWIPRFTRPQGRSRTQMSVDAARAYSRRDEEMLATRNQVESYTWGSGGLQTERHWWETLGGDGTLGAG